MNTFANGGMVVKKIDIDDKLDTGNDNFDDYFDTRAEKYHWALGSGIRIAINENFIVATDVGKAVDKRDGGLGIYIGIGYLF